MAAGATKPWASDDVRVFSRLAGIGFSPTVIFDVGAAEGSWSELLSPVFPNASFHLFEPLADFMPFYQAGLKTRLERHAKFTLHPVALGDQNGPVRMSIHPDGYSSTVFDMSGHPHYPGLHNVEMRRLDEFVERHQLPLPDLIKIDTQAAEMLVLSYARQCLDHASVVFAEAWFDRGYGPGTPLITELSAFLDTHGYQLVELGHLFYDQNHRLYGCDAFYLKRSLLTQYAPLLPATPW